MKLREYISQEIHISRRKIMDHIKAQNIYINDVLVENFGIEIQDGDILTIKNTEVRWHKINISENKARLIKWNKPSWYAVSKSDPHNDTIYKILWKEFENWIYIWRLDKESTGLLLLTNNGQLANQLWHPSNHKYKTYIVWVNKLPNAEKIEAMKNGVEIDVEDEKMFLAFESIDIIWPNKLEIKLIEGKNRHIRRLLRHFGHPVDSIHRVWFGEYKLGDLWPNQRTEVKL